MSGDREKEETTWAVDKRSGRRREKAGGRQIATCGNFASPRSACHSSLPGCAHLQKAKWSKMTFVPGYDLQSSVMSSMCKRRPWPAPRYSFAVCHVWNWCFGARPLSAPFSNVWSSKGISQGGGVMTL